MKFEHILTEVRFYDFLYYAFFLVFFNSIVLLIFLKEIHKQRIEEQEASEQKFQILLKKSQNNEILNEDENTFLDTVRSSWRNLELIKERDTFIFIILSILLTRVFVGNKSDSDFYFFSLLFIWFFFSFWAAILGARRRIGFWLSFLLSLFFSPIIGLLVTLLTKTNLKYKIDEYKKKKGY